MLILSPLIKTNIQTQQAIVNQHHSNNLHDCLTKKNQQQTKLKHIGRLIESSLMKLAKSLEPVWSRLTSQAYEESSSIKVNGSCVLLICNF